jgi:hypothetical protein
VGALGAWLFRQAWFLSEEPSLALLGLSLVVLLAAAWMLARAAYGLVRGG